MNILLTCTICQKNQWNYFLLKPSLFIHRSQIGKYNYLNCSMKVVYYIFASTPGVVRTHFRTNPRIQVFWENQFFSFCGAHKNTPPKPKKSKLDKIPILLGTPCRICPKVDPDYPRGTYENVVYDFHGTMQTIIIYSLRPVAFFDRNISCRGWLESSC